MTAQRTRPMTRREAVTRQQHAHAFIDAADLVLELGRDAGIAAGDAVCGATLGKRAAGENHNEAVALLRLSEPGKPLAASLSRLLGSKTDAQYAPALLTEGRARDLLKAARRLVDGMDEVLRLTA